MYLFTSKLHHIFTVCSVNEEHYMLTCTGCLKTGAMQKRSVRVKIILAQYSY